MSSMDLKFLPSLLMTCWLTDFLSNMDSGLDSVPGLRKIAAAEVINLCIFNCSSFFICDHQRLYCSCKHRANCFKGTNELLDLINLLGFFSFPTSCFIYELSGGCFYFVLQNPQVILPQILAANRNQLFHYFYSAFFWKKEKCIYFLKTSVFSEICYVMIAWNTGTPERSALLADI